MDGGPDDVVSEEVASRFVDGGDTSCGDIDPVLEVIEEVER